MPLYLEAPSASEEVCSIPFPPRRRKLHIRSLLLPFQTGTISLGSGLVDKKGLSALRADWGSLIIFSPLIAVGDLPPSTKRGAFRCGGDGRTGPPLQCNSYRQRREIFCQKKARGQRRIGYTSSPQQRTSGRKDPSLDYSGLICSMTKHSKMSPSLMSLNFSIDMPHS